MAYTKQNFKDGQILKAEHLNKIEDGIITLEQDLKDYIEELLLGGKW